MNINPTRNVLAGVCNQERLQVERSVFYQEQLRTHCTPYHLTLGLVDKKRTLADCMFSEVTDATGDLI